MTYTNSEYQSRCTLQAMSQSCVMWQCPRQVHVTSPCHRIRVAGLVMTYEGVDLEEALRREEKIYKRTHTCTDYRTRVIAAASIVEGRHAPSLPSFSELCVASDLLCDVAHPSDVSIDAHARIQARIAFEMHVTQDTEAVHGSIKCRACKQSTLTCVLRQVRSGDEGMTAFAKCTNKSCSKYDKSTQM